MIQENLTLKRKVKSLEEELRAIKNDKKDLEHKIITIEDELEWQKAQLKYEREDKRRLELLVNRKERRTMQVQEHEDLTESLATLQSDLKKLDKKRKRIESEVKMLTDMKETEVLGSATLILVDLPNIEATANKRFGQYIPLEQIYRTSLKYRNPRVFVFTNPPTPFFKQLSGSSHGDNRIQVRRVTQVKEKGEGSGANRYQDVDATLVLVGTQQVESRNYNKLILFSGDGDFLPLVQHCLKKGMKVTVVGIEGAVAKAYKEVVKRVKYLTPIR
ncbi:MAG: NYN domain-containing protein [Promethearchaeota archaeon]